MNLLLLKREQFKENQVRNTWKSCVKFPGVLIVKMPIDEKYQVFYSDSWNHFCCCGTHVQISWVRCWLVWGCLSMLLRDIQSVCVMPVGLWDLSRPVDPMFRVWGNWFVIIASNQGLLATGFREALYQMPGVFYLSLV